MWPSSNLRLERAVLGSDPADPNRLRVRFRRETRNGDTIQIAGATGKKPYCPTAQREVRVKPKGRFEGVVRARRAGQRYEVVLVFAAGGKPAWPIGGLVCLPFRSGCR